MSSIKREFTYTKHLKVSESEDMKRALKGTIIFLRFESHLYSVGFKPSPLAQKCYTILSDPISLKHIFKKKYFSSLLKILVTPLYRKSFPFWYPFNKFVLNIKKGVHFPRNVCSYPLQRQFSLLFEVLTIEVSAEPMPQLWEWV